MLKLLCFKGGQIKMSQKKRENKYYTIIVVPSNSSKRTRNFYLTWQTFRVVGISCLLLITVITSLSLFINHLMQDETLGKDEIQIIQEEMEKQKEENEKLIKENEEYNAKILTLSEGINQRVENEKALETEKNAKSVPKGFPLSGTATMKEQGELSNLTVVFTADEGIAVIASGDGKVIECGDDEEYGRVIRVDHGNDYISIYRCESDFMVKEGQTIVKGTALFNMKENKQELGYQITLGGEFIDPLEVMEIKG